MIERIICYSKEDANQKQFLVAESRLLLNPNCFVESFFEEYKKNVVPESEKQYFLLNETF